MSLFLLTDEVLKQYNLDYMKKQLSQPNEPDLMYRAWPSSEGENFYIESYPILRRTPAGVWIDAHGRKRFINLSWAKRWACPTRKEAVESLLRRMRRWEALLRRDLKRAEQMQRTLAELKA